jgi:hypothetical protein
MQRPIHNFLGAGVVGRDFRQCDSLWLIEQEISICQQNPISRDSNMLRNSAVRLLLRRLASVDIDYVANRFRYFLAESQRLWPLLTAGSKLFATMGVDADVV